MAITLSQVESALEEGLAFVQQISPLASLGGPAAAAIGTVVGDIAGVADTLLTTVAGDASIIAGGNVAAITALQVQLQAANATLVAQIEAS